MFNRNKILILWLLLLLGTVAVFHLRTADFVPTIEELSFSNFLNKVDNQEIQEVTVKEGLFTGKLKGTAGETGHFRVEGPKQIDTAMIEKIRASGAEVFYKTQEELYWPQLILSWLPMIILFGFFFFSMRSIQGGGGRAMSFGRSKAKLVEDTQKRVTFKDVAGVEEAEEELEEIIAFLKEPKKFTRLGGRIPKGVLLMGSPGTGKTLLARAVAGEAGVPFFSISGSDFVEMFVGVGASVTGDTPVLIRTKEKTKLVPIGEFVDTYYSDEEDEGHTVPVKEIQTLGMEAAETGFRGTPPGSSKMFFGGSTWKNVRAVYRHKVDQIYEIHYHGGVLETTGDHSVFVRSRNLVTAKKTSELKPGDCLVNLPFKVRSSFVPGVGTTHKVKAHCFPEAISHTTLPLIEEDEETLSKFNFVMTHRDVVSQSALGEAVGVSQSTVGLWQRGMHLPRTLTKNLTRNPYPTHVAVSPGLMRLFGYYTAEGRNNRSLDFTFGIHEKELHEDCIGLMRECLGVTPSENETEDNTLRIIYYSAPMGRFFERHCGNGSHRKHVPEILWDLPREYFLSYLEGYSRGDGYTTPESKLVVSSVSRQLILELAWLAAMHGIQVGIGTSLNQEGRVIKNKPTQATRYWRLTIGKTSHPFLEKGYSPNQFKKPIVKKIVAKPYNEYVYDLCGCEGEAFFGGAKPTLLHNSRVRDLFEQGKKNAPCIVFIDEIDAVGRHRGAGLGGGHDEREQTLNQLLVEMDGFESNDGVIIMAATNRPDVLDPALLRPGRFDRRVVVPRPDVKGREEILKVHANRTKVAKDVDLAMIARGTPGFSGADLANVVNEAALNAARYNKESIELADFESAKDKVMMGAERKSMIISEEEKLNTAYHEAGHALVAKKLPGADPIHKVTIIPRGAALGLTQQLPTDDRYTQNRGYCENQIAILMGGRVAEELVFNQPTTGAGNDIERATELARRMVCEWGMSEKMGPLAFGRKEQQVFLGRDLMHHQDYSEETAKQIDSEIHEIIHRNYLRARKIVQENMEILKAISLALLEFETLDANQIEQILLGKKLKPKVVKKAETPQNPDTQESAAEEPKKKTRIPPVPEPTKA